jgi:hypothetical protein
MSTTPLTLQERLDEARKAYHALITGTMPRVVVDISGERVEFVAANRDALHRYIKDLESQLPSASSIPSNGPAGFLF